MTERVNIARKKLLDELDGTMNDTQRRLVVLALEQFVDAKVESAIDSAIKPIKNK